MTIKRTLPKQEAQDLTDEQLADAIKLYRLMDDPGEVLDDARENGMLDEVVGGRNE